MGRMNKINKVGCETAKSEFGHFDQSITLLWFSSFLRVVESTPNASRYAFSALVIRSLNISHSFLHLSLTCRGITTFIFTFTVQFFSHIFKCQCEFNNIYSLHTASHGALPSWGWPCMGKRWNHHRLKRLYKDLSKDKRISHTLTRMFALDIYLVPKRGNALVNNPLSIYNSYFLMSRLLFQTKLHIIIRNRRN